MKSLSIRMVTRLICAATLCIFAAAGQAEGFDPPEVVTIDMLAELYEPVVFDHAMHMENYSCGACHHHTAGEEVQRESCRRCHAVSTSGKVISCVDCHKEQTVHTALKDTLYHIDKPGLKGALHLQCIGCHKEESGPVGCMECHAFTSAGRKRFGL